MGGERTDRAGRQAAIPRSRQPEAGVANRRIRLVLALLTLAFALILGRAFWLQVVRSDPLGRLAASQQRETVTLPAARGAIFDRTGTRFALGEEATTVYADPRRIRNPRAVALAAARDLGVDPNELYRRLTDRSRRFVYVARQADPERAAGLEARKLRGLGYYPEERRIYPQRSVAAQVLGYAGVDNRGLAGLELALDRVLAGKPGSETVVKDPLGRAIDVLGSTPPREGRDVFLAVDQSIQSTAEAVLRRTVDRWRARSATALVLEPTTGKVLAMTMTPGFDANRYPHVLRARQRNRAVTDTYEPGSTFKLVTVAAVLAAGLASPSTAFTLPYSLRVADRVIRDAEPRATERMTVARILTQSSNVGAITLAKMLGKKRLSAWIARFGFGRRTGIDFPGESPGIVLPPDHWSGSTIGNVPIGQGIAVTPVQMAAAYATVANKGVWVRPHLVERVGGRPLARHFRRRIISGPIAKQLLSMLVDVVAEGTGTLAAVNGYTVAGKTGTAAKPDRDGGYSASKYVASFVGIVPADAPRLVILVTVDEPHDIAWGGVVAAPAFREIANFSLQYLGIPSTIPSSQDRSMRER